MPSLVELHFELCWIYQGCHTVQTEAAIILKRAVSNLRNQSQSSLGGIWSSFP